LVSVSFTAVQQQMRAQPGVINSHHWLVAVFLRNEGFAYWICHHL